MSKCSVIIAFRWVENKTVATRLNNIWDNLDKLYTFWDSLPKSKRPSSKSYDTLKAVLDDKLMPAKLHFFDHIASIIEPYLKRYQTDKPMVPFMYHDLKDIVYQVLEIIVKPAVSDFFKAKPQTWEDIDLSIDNNLISARKLNLGFAIEEDINNFKKSHPANADEKISKFRRKAKCFIIAIVSKLFERSLLGSALLKSTSVLDPDVLQGNTRDKLITRFNTLLKVIMNLSILVANSCNKALFHSKYLLDNDLKMI